MLPDYEYLIEEMKNKRRDMGWSREKLANEAGVSESTVSDMEEGVETLGYRDLRRIDRALDRGVSEKEKGS